MKRDAIACVAVCFLVLMNAAVIFAADSLTLSPSTNQSGIGDYPSLTITANKSRCSWVSSNVGYLWVSPEQTTGATFDGTSTTKVTSTNMKPNAWVWITATCQFANGKRMSACIEYDIQCYGSFSLCSITRGSSGMARINGRPCTGTADTFDP